MCLQGFKAFSFFTLYVAVHLVPWLKEPHTHCSTSVYTAKLCSSQNWFHHKHNIGWHKDPHLQCFSMVHRALHLRNLHFKWRERREEGKHGLLMNQHPKALKRGSQLSCHKLKVSHFQSPKFLINGWCAVILHAIVISLIVLKEYSAVRGRKDSLHPPACSPSWAKLLAFTLHRRPLQCEPCTSKTFPHIKPGIDEYVGSLLHHIHVLTVFLYICCQLLSRGEKHFPVFIWQPLHEAISHDLHIN